MSNPVLKSKGGIRRNILADQLVGVESHDFTGYVMVGSDLKPILVSHRATRRAGHGISGDVVTC